MLRIFESGSKTSLLLFARAFYGSYFIDKPHIARGTANTKANTF
jgi:hypothetical protein